MKKFFLVIVALFLNGHQVRTQPLREQNQFCEESTNYSKCIEAFNQLPKIKYEKENNNQKPVKIKVIPYKKISNRRNKSRSRKATTHWKEWEEYIYD